MTLPSILDAYFRAQNAHDIDGLVACFASDAQVRDEGEDISGHETIRTCKEKVRDTYHVSIEPLRHWTVSGNDLVTARVAGTFPGSPIELTYRYEIKDAKIARLEVLA